MKTLYIFDMGGVVTYNTDVFPSIINYLGITEKEFMIFAGEDLEKFLKGRITSEEFWNKFSFRYGKKVKEELFSKFFHPSLNQEMIDILKQLKGYSRVVCGTNTFDPHYNYHLKRGDYNIFDTVYASNIIGLLKPDPDFYWYILGKEKVEPERAIFIDDTKENVLSAQKIGIKSILFTDSDSLRFQIKTFNNCL